MSNEVDNNELNPEDIAETASETTDKVEEEVEATEESIEDDTEAVAEAVSDTDSDESSLDEPSSSSTQEKPKKKGKGRVVLLAVVIAVVLLFGGGGIVYATQHSNPQFCNLICHVPMTPYVESYMDGTSVNAQQVDLDAPLGVVNHRDSDQDVVCVTCHTDGIETQIQEGIAWVTGNYTLPLELTMTAREPKDAHQRSGVETCLDAGCHEGISSLDDLKKFMADQVRNPHQNHNGDQNCTICHQQHEQSVLFCTQCHDDMEVPDGWLTYDEKQKQIKEAKTS